MRRHTADASFRGELSLVNSALTCGGVLELALAEGTVGFTTILRNADGRKKAQEAQKDSAFVIFVPLCGQKNLSSALRPEP